MRLTRVYVDAVLNSGSIVALPNDTGAHLAKVLRARSGDELILFNGDGQEYRASIDTVRGSKVSALVDQGSPVDRESPFSTTLVQCVPRGDRMDFIVQKATELGVSRIVPVLSQRSVVRLDAAQAQSKAAHWRAVAISACEQCGRNRLPVIDVALPLLDFLGEDPSEGSKLVFDPDFEPRALDHGHGSNELSAQIAIGPEGGFAPDELEAFRLSQYSRATLGPRVLRTETAAIVALAWLQSRFGDLSAKSDFASGITDG